MWPLLADTEEAAHPPPFFFLALFLNLKGRHFVSDPFILIFLQMSSHGLPRHIQANT